MRRLHLFDGGTGDRLAAPATRRESYSRASDTFLRTCRYPAPYTPRDRSRCARGTLGALRTHPEKTRTYRQNGCQHNQ